MCASASTLPPACFRQHIRSAGCHSTKTNRCRYTRISYPSSSFYRAFFSKRKTEANPESSNLQSNPLRPASSTEHATSENASSAYRDPNSSTKHPASENVPSAYRNPTIHTELESPSASNPLFNKYSTSHTKPQSSSRSYTIVAQNSRQKRDSVDYWHFSVATLPAKW